MRPGRHSTRAVTLGGRAATRRADLGRRRFLGGALAGACLAPLGCRGAAGARCPEPAAAAVDPRRAVNENMSPSTGDDGAAAQATSAADPFASLRGFCDGVAPVDAGELRARRDRAQRLLADAGLAALVVEAGVTHGYFAPTRWRQSERPLLLVLPAKGSPVWIGPAFEARTLGELLEPGSELLTWQEDESPYARASEALRAAGVGRRASIAVDPATRGFLVEGLREELGARRVVDGGAIVDGCRMIKGPRELDRLRRANEATKAALQLAATLLEPGAREDEFAALVHRAQEAAGLSNIWSLVLFGPSASFPHGTRERRALRAGELVLVDTGGSLHGYSSDISRTWAPTAVRDPLRRAWDTVLAAQEAALQAIRPGVTCAEVDAAARAVITAAGYGRGFERFTHRLGHGIGLQGHEPPYLRPGNRRALAPGMTMSDEPGIYVPGEFGVRIEDIVAVTDDGVEVFGPRPRSLERPFG